MTRNRKEYIMNKMNKAKIYPEHMIKNNRYIHDEKEIKKKSTNKLAYLILTYSNNVPNHKYALRKLS